DGWSNDTQFGHEFFKLLEEERLGAIGKRMLRIVVHLEEQAIGARRNRRPSHGRNFVAASRAMRWVGNNGKVREFLDNRDRGDIERVARIGLKCTDAALAKNHVVVAASHDVLGAQQELFDRRGHSALEEHGLPGY